MIVEPDIHHGGAQGERLEHVAQNLRHTCYGIGLAISDLAEEHVILQRGGGVVAGGIEKLDLAACLVRQALAEGAARFEEALLHAFLENAEAMPRRDQLERQGQQLVPLLPVEPADPAIFSGGEDRGEFRQFMRADKLNCSKNSCSGGRPANISVIVAAT